MQTKSKIKNKKRKKKQTELDLYAIKYTSFNRFKSEEFFCLIEISIKYTRQSPLFKATQLGVILMHFLTVDIIVDMYLPYFACKM